jgi:hypothetical protein
MIGREVTFDKSSSSSEVNIITDGAIVGQLDTEVGNSVALALERGQSFKATIEKVFPIYNDRLKQIGAYMDLKVDYLLEKGQPAIETIRCWRCVDSPDASHEQYAPESFFTKVAGVTFEGRQRIIARCSDGELLKLVREPDNRYDKGAIKVMRLNGQQIGYISHDVSRGGGGGLADRMDRGSQYQCRISDITGGDGRALGVNIEITEGEGFADVFPEEKTSASLNVEPAHSNLGWLLVVAVVVLFVVIVIIQIK